MAKAPTRKDKGKTATSAASKNGKAKKKDGAAVKKPRSETFVVCPYTDQKVWISKATLSDLKPTTTHKDGNNNKTSSSSSIGSRTSVHKNDKKRLWTISSSQIRHDHYAEVAQALSIYEQNLLPSSGDRSWEVSVQLSEPNARVLFRSWKGQMEVRIVLYYIALHCTVLYSCVTFGIVCRLRHSLFVSFLSISRCSERFCKLLDG